MLIHKYNSPHLKVDISNLLDLGTQFIAVKQPALKLDNRKSPLHEQQLVSPLQCAHVRAGYERDHYQGQCQVSWPGPTTAPTPLRANTVLIIQLYTVSNHSPRYLCL